SVAAGSRTVILRQLTNGTPLDIGTAHTTTWGWSDAQLDRITCGTLQIGDTNSGAIAVSADVTRPSSTNVVLTSGDDITFGPGLVNTGGGTLLLHPGRAPAAVHPVRTSTDVSAGTTSFFAGSDLAINIAGTSPDTLYDRLFVSGAVNLTGADLVLTGSFVPA